MLSATATRRPAALLMVMTTAVAMSGCAGLPRIDPSGRRLLVWPEPTPSVTGVAPVQGNIDAPPVTAPGSGSLNPFDRGGLLGGFGGNQPATNANPPIAGGAGRPPTPDERLSITPERVLAPVGSEVILRAGVCGDNGYLRTNRRVEWMLGTQGTGQFVTVGEQGEMDILRMPWQRPNKQDNTYAVGYTSPFHTCLNRGTADTTDDVQVRPGDAWITVTSASEGASYVTAYAPESRDWDARRARATIYWVDAEWRIPPSVNVQPGQTANVVTSITRKSDGAPVDGWQVRYEVIQGDNARLGYGSGQSSVATTNAQGQAVMQVTPTDDAPGSAVLRATIVRPAQSSPMPSPELQLGTGETVVTWSPTTIPGGGTGPPIGGGGGVTPPAPFEPPPRDTTPPIGTPDRGAPLLEVIAQRDNQRPIRVNDVIPVTITVENRGDAPARNIIVYDRFEAGLDNAGAPPGESQIKYTAFPDLAPGESDVVKLEFRAVAPGRHCHAVRVTVQGRDGREIDAAVTEQCFEIVAPAPPAVATLEVEVEGELRRAVNDLYTYRARVRNTSGVAAENVRMEIRYSDTLSPELAEEGHFPIPGGLVLEYDRIDANSSAPFYVNFRCLRATPPTQPAEVTLFVAATGVPEETRTRTVAIDPAAAAPPTRPAPPSASPLRGVLDLSNNPVRVGQPLTLAVAIENNGSAPAGAVEFLVRFPPQLRPRLQSSQSPIAVRETPLGLQFGPVTSIAPGAPVRVTIPCDAVQRGVGNVVLQGRVSGGPIVVEQSTPVQVEP